MPVKKVLAPLGRVLRPIGSWLGRRSTLQLGVMWVVAIVLAGVLLMNKADILLALRDGEKLEVEFASAYKIKPTVSKVKIAGVKVGSITGVSEKPGQGARISMKLDRGTRQKLGSRPAAAIRPATFLGGPGLSAYIELTPGGDPGRFDGKRIPMEQTRIPVEFDRFFEIFQDEARKGAQTSLSGLDEILSPAGRKALDDVLEDAPPALGPASGVVGALSGQEQGDLARVVQHLGRAAAVLTESDGELESVVKNLATVASTLAERTPDSVKAVQDMPATLQAARAGLTALDGTLTRLQATAPAARPGVARLTELLRRLPPVLAEARPVLADLRPLAADLRAALDDLAPSAGLLREFLGDLEGPVLQRLEGSIVPALLGPYTETGRNTRLYQELGYGLAGLAGVTQYMNPEGAQLNFYIGLNSTSLPPPPGGAAPPAGGGGPDRWSL
jgi:phospholipid/cholesterol/gamma-HCH transport system substrate-binding protein